MIILSRYLEDFYGRVVISKLCIQKNQSYVTKTINKKSKVNKASLVKPLIFIIFY